jgi:hypothetical protein
MAVTWPTSSRPSSPTCPTTCTGRAPASSGSPTRPARWRNYADRYDGRPDKEKALKEWLQRAWDDSSRVLTVHDAAHASEAIDNAFGPGLGARIAKRLGLQIQRLRALGALGSTTAGRLTTDVSGSHRPHRFYGQPAS